MSFIISMPCVPFTRISERGICSSLSVVKKKKTFLLFSSERDELQKDIETMCLEQAGVSGSVDISTRMQARRLVLKELSVPEIVSKSIRHAEDLFHQSNSDQSIIGCRISL